MFWTVVNVVAILGSVTVLVVAAVLDPDPAGFGTHTQLGLPPCTYLTDTGEPCVSCGMTTAYACMMEADVPAAVRANPMGVVMFLLTLAMPFWFGHALWTGDNPFRFADHPWGRWLLPVLVVALVVCWLIRA